MDPKTLQLMAGGTTGLGVTLVGINNIAHLGLDPTAQGLISGMVLAFLAFVAHQTTPAQKMADAQAADPAKPEVKP